tara:strand:- start:118 stop:1278 length:1161 start_codon:yes stop_codon:yes gene_type:complete
LVFKEDEGVISISKDCVDIISTSADPTRNFFRVRFRNPKLFVGGKYSTPQWGQKAAMTIGTKYYGVKGCKITMAQPVGGRWMIQSVLIPKNGGVEMNEELALQIANHIQDRIEREGQWTAVMCRDNETKRYISKIKGQHIERDEGGRFAPHAAEEFGAWDANCSVCNGTGWMPKKGDPKKDAKIAKLFGLSIDELTLTPCNAGGKSMGCWSSKNRNRLRRLQRAESFEAPRRVNTCTHRYEDTVESWNYSAWKMMYSDIEVGDGSSGYVETGVRCDICGQERVGSWAIESPKEGFQITKGEEGRMPRSYGWTSVNEMFGAEQTLYWSHKRNKECSYCGHGKNHKAALLSDDGKLFGCYKCNSYPNEEEMVTDYEAEEFEAQRGMKS